MPKISEAGREILKKWQDMGVEFKQVAHSSNPYLNFKRDAGCYSIPEQPVPEWVTLGDLENMRAKGVQLKPKPKSVKRYMAMYKGMRGGKQVFVSVSTPNETIEQFTTRIQTDWGTIIGKVEERDVEG